MSYRILFAGLVAAGFLTACGEGEQPAPAKDKAAFESAMEKASEGAKNLNEAATEAAQVAMKKGEELTQAAATKAEDLMTQAERFIGEGKTDLAARVMEPLRGLKESLPESIRIKIADLEDRIKGASAAAPASGATGHR